MLNSRAEFCLRIDLCHNRGSCPHPSRPPVSTAHQNLYRHSAEEDSVIPCGEM